MDITILKLGGSIITREGAAGLFDRRNALRLARELEPLARGVVLIHGTGLVGKPPAIAHGYAADGRLAADRRLLALRIRDDLRALNRRVVSTFLAAGVAATPLAVEHVFNETLDGLRAPRLKGEIKKIIANGQVPVFYGDLMPRGDGSFQVFSSDLIALILARALRPRRCLFLTAAPGVYRKGGKGAILEQLSARTARLMDRPRPAEVDVSGGMAAKVRCALEIARYCESCRIASGRDAGVLMSLLQDLPAQATRVTVNLSEPERIPRRGFTQ